VSQHCYLVEVSTNGLLLLCDLIKSVCHDYLFVKYRPENEVAEGQFVPFSFVVYPQVLVIGTADSDRSVPFSHCITLLSCAIFVRGLGVRPDQQAFGGLPNAMLAFHTTATDTAPSAVVFPYANAAHTRSTLRDNRFHRRRWDTCPLWVSAAKIGVFVCDSNFTVTVTFLPSPYHLQKRKCGSSILIAN
jgi:hypothetical protein